MVHAIYTGRAGRIALVTWGLLAASGCAATAPVAPPSAPAPSTRAGNGDATAPGDDRALTEALEREAHAQHMARLLDTFDGDVRAARTAVALARLNGILRRREQWTEPMPRAVDARVAQALAWGDGVLRREIAAPAEASRPLLAERALQARGEILSYDALAPTAAALKTIVAQSGERVCASLRASSSSSTPYFTRFAAAYCRHFAASGPETAPLPNLVSSVDVKGAIEGVPGATRGAGAAQKALQAWLEASIFYAPDARGHAVATLSGRATTRFGTTEVHVEKPWIEPVPYVAQETYDEVFLQAYDDVVKVEKPVSYTVFERRFGNCGNSHSRCMTMRPVIRERIDIHEEHVVRYRQAHRPATRDVTKYRETPRVFDLAALEHTREGDVALAIKLDVGSKIAPVALFRNAHTVASDLEHDVTFEPAGVAPSHPDPARATPDFVLAENLATLASDFVAAARTRWLETYCQKESYSVDDAARCAYLRAETYPDGVRRALASVLDDDLDEALALPR